MNKRYRLSMRITLAIIFIMPLVGACGVLVPFLGVAQDDYFVAPYGDDDNPGTLEEPWRTIQKAADTLGPGNTVHVLESDYPERVQVRISGTSESPITFRAEGIVTLKGFNVLADYIAIQGFEITNTENHPRNGLGIFVSGSHCVLIDNYIHFAVQGGITLSATSSDCTVENNRLYRNGMAGIEVNGVNHLIEGNEIWGTIQYHPDWENPPSWVDADGLRFFGSGHRIRSNYVHDISYAEPENVDPHIDCFQTWADSFHEAASDILLEGNVCEVLESQAAQESGHGFMLANASDITIQNNIVIAYGGVNGDRQGTSGLTIVNNVFINDLSFQDFYPMGIRLIDIPDVVIKNNIFYNQPFNTISIIGNTRGHEIDYNLAYRSDGQPSQCYQVENSCVTPAPQNHYWDVDPLFVDPGSGDFHLQQGSPAINVGVVLSEVLQDLEGNARPQGSGFDLGAYEYQSE